MIKATVSQIIKQNCSTEILLDKSVFQIVGNQNYRQNTITLPLRYLSFYKTVLINLQSMSTKKQISSLCNLYSVYEELPEEVLDETDVNSYFYHNILDISQSHHQIVRVSKGFLEKSFAFKVF